MSGRCSGWVIRYGPRRDDHDRAGKPYGVRVRGLRAVLGVIADAANQDGEHAHPGVAAIVEGSQYARAQALKLVAELVAEGWLEVTEQGNGRGNATVYRVRMDWRETVRPADGSAGRNRPIRDEKPSDPDAETVRSSAAAPHTQLEPNELPNAAPTAPGAEERPEMRIVREHWDWCHETGTPSPTLRANVKGNPFMALVAIVHGLLEAGWPEPEVVEALRETAAFTVNAITLTLNQRRQRTTGARLSPAQQALAEHRVDRERRNAG